MKVSGESFCHHRNVGLLLVTAAVLCSTFARSPVSPVLEFVYRNADGSYSAMFGYHNQNDFEVMLPVGSQNHFHYHGQGGNGFGQPTSFKPGRVRSAFQTRYDGTNLVWLLDGRSATASNSANHGLLGKYFSCDSANNVIYNVNSSINMDWESRSPLPGIPETGFRVEWSAQLVPETTGDYIFLCDADDGIRVFLDGFQVLGTWTDGIKSGIPSAVHTLTAATPYRLRVEYYQNIGASKAKLYWSRIGSSAEVIPSRVLTAQESNAPLSPSFCIANDRPSSLEIKPAHGDVFALDFRVISPIAASITIYNGMKRIVELGSLSTTLVNGAYTFLWHATNDNTATGKMLAPGSYSVLVKGKDLTNDRTDIVHTFDVTISH